MSHVWQACHSAALAIRTNDVARAHRVAAALRCGIVWVNDHHRLDPASPWGGVKLSGIGRETGQESFDAHFDVKSVMVNIGGNPSTGMRTRRVSRV